MKTYSVDQEEKGHSFVGGNTRYLKEMSQKELAILAQNGDQRVKVTETPDEVAAETAVEKSQEEPAEETSAAKGRRSGRPATDAEQGA